MFLGTTALSEFWSRDEEILFLGTWCLRYDRRSDWESLRYHILPFAWDDRKRLDDAVVYLDQCYERMLSRLTDYLNAIHEVSHSHRYWRILIGPWLEYYLHALYDRYIHLLDALKVDGDLTTLTLHADCYRTPADTPHFDSLISADAYNLQLYSQILQVLGCRFPQRRWQGHWMEDEQSGHNPRLLATGKSFARKLVQWGIQTSTALVSRRSAVALCDMYVSRWALCRLAWKARATATALNFHAGMERADAVFDERRAGLASIPVSDSFEHVLVQLLPQHLPTLYLEGYARAQVDVVKSQSDSPRVIVSATGWMYNEAFKLVAAEAAERGSKLVAFQHGGGYGTLRHFPVEKHEATIADRYYVWGWADGKSEKLRNLPSPKLSPLVSDQRQATHFRHRTSGSILFVATNHPRYVYRFHSMPLGGSQWDAYWVWQMRFLAALPGAVRQQLILRLPPEDFGRSVRQGIEREFAGIRFDSGRDYHDRLKTVRMVVVDHPMTPFLESLRFGVPTILYWDPKRWRIREEAASDFESLTRVGILCDSPEAAAAKVVAIRDEPWAWWGSKEVQEIRQRFADRYALARGNWMDAWVHALQKEITLSESEYATSST